MRFAHNAHMRTPQSHRRAHARNMYNSISPGAFHRYRARTRLMMHIICACVCLMPQIYICMCICCKHEFALMFHCRNANEVRQTEGLRAVQTHSRTQNRPESRAALSNHTHVRRLRLCTRTYAHVHFTHMSTSECYACCVRVSYTRII